MSSDKPGRVVFIGNIPYGLTEEQIIHIFSTAGQVLSFRLVYDSDTGRPKGFGFAEFADTDAAASAVRNLDKHQIMGRELRVDFSHVGGKDDAAPAGYQPQPPQPSNGYAPPPATSNGLPPLPPGADVPPGLTCPDAISKTLSTLPVPQLLDILSQMKNLVMGDPNKATELLKQAPQLSYAIFQALLLMGLVDTSVLASVVEQASQPPPQPVQAPPPRTITTYQPPPPPQLYQPPPPQSFQPYPQLQGQTHVATPPIYQQPYQPPPVQAPPPQPPSQEELLKQVLAMPQSEVDRLPPAERQQIMALKQQFGAPMGY
ncbi:MAG: hypothetical protein Q9187_006103 [Circinaria calcarea]